MKVAIAKDILRGELRILRSQVRVVQGARPCRGSHALFAAGLYDVAENIPFGRETAYSRFHGRRFEKTRRGTEIDSSLLDVVDTLAAVVGE